jgi:hypothetical protein
MRRQQRGLARQAVAALQDLAAELRAARGTRQGERCRPTRTGPPRRQEGPEAIIARWDQVLRDGVDAQVVLDLRQQPRLQADLSALAVMARHPDIVPACR